MNNDMEMPAPDDSAPNFPPLTRDENEHALDLWQRIKMFGMARLKDIEPDFADPATVGINVHTASLEELVLYCANVKRLSDLLGEYVSVLDSNFNTAAIKGGEIMRDRGIDSLVVNDAEGHKVANAKFDLVFAPSIKDTEKAFAYLRRVGLGDLIKETVHPMALKSSLKKKLYGLSDEEVEDEANSGGIVEFPDEEVISIWQQPRIKITKLH